MSLYTKLELDVTQLHEVQDASNLAVKYKLPAIIVHSDLTSQAHMLRGRIGGQYKIITPVDWPRGNNFGQHKLRELSIDSIDVDGFEILLTPGKSLIESRNEMKTLTDYLKTYISETVEVRFVIGVHDKTEDEITTICTAMRDVRKPAFVRTDIHTKLPVNGTNAQTHNNIINLITKTIGVPIKISGNVNNLKVVAQCSSARRFAVSLQQANAIIKEYKQNPDQLRTLSQETE